MYLYYLIGKRARRQPKWQSDNINQFRFENIKSKSIVPFKYKTSVHFT